MNKTVIDARTGKITVVQLTVDELRKRQEESVEFELQKNTRANKDNIRELREDAITALLNIYEGDRLAPKAIRDYLEAKNG